MRKPVLFWFRRDLRFYDNCALYNCLSGNENVLPIFIFDENILKQFPEPDDKRISIIHRRLKQLNEVLKPYQSHIKVYKGLPIDIFKNLYESHKYSAIYSNADYEPFASLRDSEIQQFCESRSVRFLQFKDSLLFAKDDILKKNRTPYLVFTPYAKQWRQKLSEIKVDCYFSEQLLSNFTKTGVEPILPIEEIGYQEQEVSYTDKIEPQKISNYATNRDRLELDGTTKLSVALRFGIISIRELIKASFDSPVFMNELIWREFYTMILWHFPQSPENAIKPLYDTIKWENNEEQFEKWCKGLTGFPLVDAGMRELNQTGFMHNRSRMITASFLTKHLLVDWRWGELYFRQKLLDFDLSSNVGGWQWAAGSGCDAAPYFRIFSPVRQQERFDPRAVYIKKWVPEFGTDKYPSPIVDHATAREKALRIYKNALSGNNKV